MSTRTKAKETKKTTRATSETAAATTAAAGEARDKGAATADDGGGAEIEGAACELADALERVRAKLATSGLVVSGGDGGGDGNGRLSAVASGMTQADAAKLHVVVAYCLASLFYSEHQPPNNTNTIHTHTTHNNAYTQFI
jgi:hypothetical protein